MLRAYSVRMNVRRSIRKRIRHRSGGVDVAADVNAAVAGNVSQAEGTHTKVSSHQRIVQRDGRTVVSESHITTSERAGGGEAEDA